VSVTLWLNAEDPEPAVPVTVSVYVPGDVPLLEGGDVPPPPHPGSARVSNNPAASGIIVDCQRFTPARVRRILTHPNRARKKATINKPLRPGDGGGIGESGRERGPAIEGAVVVTVTVTFVAELPGVTEGAAQVASEGTPVHVKLTLSSNPP